MSASTSKNCDVCGSTLNPEGFCRCKLVTTPPNRGPIKLPATKKCGNCGRTLNNRNDLCPCGAGRKGPRPN